MKFAWRAAGFAVVVAGAIVGCSRDTPRTFTVGEHRVTVSVPARWEVIDQGGQVRLRKAAAELVLQDLGPVGPQGIRREVERAATLWQSGQAAAARTRMGVIPVPRDLFLTPLAATEFWAAWSRVSQAPAETPYADLEPAFAEILANVDALPPSDFATLTDAGLAKLGHDHRREVKSRSAVAIDHREAVDIETRTRQTHEWPQRILFVLNDGYLLALSTRQGAELDAVKAFESLRTGLHFAADDPRK